MSSFETMFSVRIFYSFLLCISCIFCSVLAEKSKADAESECLKEEWMFRCSDKKVTRGLLTEKEIKSLSTEECGAYLASELFYTCSKYPVNIHKPLMNTKEVAIHYCMKKDSPTSWSCRTSYPDDA